MGRGTPKCFDGPRQQEELTLVTCLLSEQSSHLIKGFNFSPRTLLRACRPVELLVSSLWRKVWDGGGFRRRVAQLSTMDLFEPAPDLPDGPCPDASQHDPGPTGLVKVMDPTRTDPRAWVQDPRAQERLQWAFLSGFE